MSIHFVSRSTLSSDDGFKYTEESKEAEDQRATRISKEAIAQQQKPLFLQLQEQRDLKTREQENITKLIFAPPKALDEEEAGFLNDLAKQQEQYEKLIANRTSKEVEMFRESQRHQSDVTGPVSIINLTRKKLESSNECERKPSLIIKAKRKSTQNHSSSDSEKRPKQDSSPVSSVKIEEASGSIFRGPRAEEDPVINRDSSITTIALSLLGDYDSGEEVE